VQSNLSRLLGDRPLQAIPSLLLIMISLVTIGGSAYGAGYPGLGQAFFVAATIVFVLALAILAFGAADNWRYSGKRHAVLDALIGYSKEGREYRDMIRDRRAAHVSAMRDVVEPWEESVRNALERFDTWIAESFDREAVPPDDWLSRMDMRLEKIETIVREVRKPR
jgi:hypothetical protein